MRAIPRVEQLEGRELPAAPFQTLPVMNTSDPGLIDHLRAVYALGRDLGRDTGSMMKAGDSNSTSYSDGVRALTPFLNPLGLPDYQPASSNLAVAYPQLIDAWVEYRDSFARVSTAAYPGWQSADVRAAVAGEVARSNASVALVMVGTNDVGTGVPPELFRENITAVVRTLLRLGVVPVLSTIPDFNYAGGRFAAGVAAINQIIADIASSYRVPLWNLWHATTSLAADGLDGFGVHLSVSPNGAGSFYPADLFFGQNVRNLQALTILDWFRESIADGLTFVPPKSGWEPMAADRVLYAAGRDVGFSPTVDVYDATTGQLVNRFLAFEQSFGGGVRVASADVNGDRFTDIVCATAAGTVSRVRVFSGADGSLLANRVVFGPGFTKGLTVAARDLDGDGAAEVVVGQSQGNSVTRVYSGRQLSLIVSFRTFPGFAGGVSVAVAHVKDHGVVVVAASAARPVVRYFDIEGHLLASFRAASKTTVGLSIAAADVTGDEYDELALVRIRGQSRVTIMDSAERTALATVSGGRVRNSNFGVRLGTLRASEGNDTLIVANGPGSNLLVLGFDDLSGDAALLYPSNRRRSYGIFVG